MTLPRKSPSATSPSPQSSGCCRLRGRTAGRRFLTRLGVLGRSLLLRFLRGMSARFRRAGAKPFLGGFLGRDLRLQESPRAVGGVAERRDEEPDPARLGYESRTGNQ